MGLPTYGSDAVCRVINFTRGENFKGIRGHYRSYGFANQDKPRRHAGYGGRLPKTRATLMLSYNYSRTEAPEQPGP